MKNTLLSVRKPVQISLVLALAVASTACSSDLISSHKKVKRAPISQKQSGLIVSMVSEYELAQVINAHSEARVRYVNRDHDLFEVFGVDKAELAEALPEANIYQNDFFTLESQTASAKVQILQALDEEADEEVAATASIPEDCDKNMANGPSAKISVEEPILELLDRVIDLGTEVTLSNTKSAAHPDHPSEITKAWVIMPPNGSLQEQAVYSGETLSFKPDNMGVYMVGLVIQDERKKCALAEFPVIVTDNAEYKGGESYISDELMTPDLSPFSHLERMNAVDSWDISQGQGVVLAVIDTGVNYNHPDLKDNILVNAKGMVGYDFANDDAFPFDDQGHGSHVAGLAASTVFGLAKSASIMPIKALTPMGGDVASVAGAILFAVDNGAQVINLSLGNYGKAHPSMITAITYAEKHGVLIVAAAGNGHPLFGYGLNTDTRPNFPSALPNQNILAIAALGTNDRLTFYSNYGLKTVDVAAPGGSGPKPEDMLLSAYYENASGNLYQPMSGTSMATPIVAGIAAQILSLNPKMSPSQIKRNLMTTGPKLAALKTKVKSGRGVDALAAVNSAKSTTGLADILWGDLLAGLLE